MPDRLLLPPRSPDARKTGRTFGDTDRLVFVHMEKAAGSSVHESLATLFPEDRVCPERFSSINLRSAEDLAPFRLFTVHGTLHDLASVPERRFFITILRDPIERMISAYRFWSSATWDHITRDDLHVSRLCKSRTLPEFLADDALTLFPFLWNGYAQRLSGAPEINPFTDYRARSQDILDQALVNLERLDGVGIAEAVGLSMLAISNALGVANPYDGRHVNVTADNAIVAPQDYEQPNPVELNQETLDAIHRVTALDQVIYNRAVDRLFGELHAGLSYDCQPAQGVDLVEFRDEPWFRHSESDTLVMFGPYVRLPAAHYWVTIAIKRKRVVGEKGEDPVGLLELCCGQGTQILRQRRLTNADVDRDGGMIRILLPLTRRIDDIEVRFISLTAASLLVRRRVTVALA